MDMPEDGFQVCIAGPAETATCSNFGSLEAARRGAQNQRATLMWLLRSCRPMASIIGLSATMLPAKVNGTSN
jgi:hypothetical protein